MKLKVYAEFDIRLTRLWGIQECKMSFRFHPVIKF